MAELAERRIGTQKIARRRSTPKLIKITLIRGMTRKVYIIEITTIKESSSIIGEGINNIKYHNEKQDRTLDTIF